MKITQIECTVEEARAAGLLNKGETSASPLEVLMGFGETSESFRGDCHGFYSATHYSANLERPVLIRNMHPCWIINRMAQLTRNYNARELVEMTEWNALVFWLSEKQNQSK